MGLTIDIVLSKNNIGWNLQQGALLYAATYQTFAMFVFYGVHLPLALTSKKISQLTQ